jgi:lysophospholipase L1-like esterase
MADARPKPSFAKRIVFACIPVLALLAALELGVRLLGLHESCRNGFTNEVMWTCDPILNFKLKPDLLLDGEPLNRAGFRSREFDPKPEGVFRILSLGDSCTFGIISTPHRKLDYVPEPYPQRLERLAAERLGPDRVEVLNAGVAGYNTFQGVLLLRSKLRGLEPDLITVRDGWNDHFLSEIRATPYSYREPDSALAVGVQDVLLRTALYAFTRRLALDVQALRAGGEAPNVQLPSEWTPSVPLDAYRHNLRRIVELGREQGARVWLLTSPHAFVIGANRGRTEQLPMTAKTLLEFNALPSFERLIEIHDEYNDATRAVGAELGVAVVDMDAVYRAHADEPLFLPTDVPHPTQQGHALEAETLYERLLAEGLVQPPS